MFGLSRLTYASAITAIAMLIAPAVHATPMEPCSVWHTFQFESGGLNTPDPSTNNMVPNHSATCPPDNTFLNTNAVLNGGGLTGPWTIDFPNFVDDLNVKKLWLTVITTFPELISTDIVAFDPQNTTIMRHDRTILTNGSNGFEEHWWIEPNPDREMITLTFDNPCSGATGPCVIPIPTITSITIHTISMDIPEPGTLAIMGIGLVGLGFARRRKAA